MIFNAAKQTRFYFDENKETCSKPVHFQQPNIQKWINYQFSDATYEGVRAFDMEMNQGKTYNVIKTARGQYVEFFYLDKNSKALKFSHQFNGETEIKYKYFDGYQEKHYQASDFKIDYCLENA